MIQSGFCSANIAQVAAVMQILKKQKNRKNL